MGQLNPWDEEDVAVQPVQGEEVEVEIEEEDDADLDEDLDEDLDDEELNTDIIDDES